MKLGQKVYYFFIVALMLLISYLLCSTHEKSTSGYSRRKGFCSTPFYVIIFICFIIIFVFNY